MAAIIRRTWKHGRRRLTAWGYTLQVTGPDGTTKQERVTRATWTKDDAQDALDARRRELAAPKVEAVADVPLSQVVERYLTAKGRDGKRSLKEDRRHLNKLLLPAFGPALPVRALTKEMIVAYKEQRLGQVSAFTVSNELSTLRHLLNLARDEWGYLERVPTIKLPKKPDGRLRYLEVEEIGKLLAACRTSKNPNLFAIVTVALNTGMRKSEIAGLEWQRVDLSTSRITLYRTKSGKPRGVPINRAVYEALVALEPDAKDRQEGPVFRRRDGAEWGQIRTAFDGALKRAGIKGLRFHDLRHSAASHLVMRGAHLKEVQEILGHADLKTTQRYAHLSPAHLRGAVDRLDGLTSTSLSTQSAHEGKIDADRRVSVHAPVAQVDRAAVS
jgi:integrase